MLTAFHTDVGIEKETNQDSLGIQIAETSLGKVLLAVICDGMGGLSKGELASATVIRAFQAWFDHELVEDLSGDVRENIHYRWDRLVKEQNQRIAAYGRQNYLSLGTTLTALLIVGTRFFLIGHVGDTRAYRITDKLEQLTEDQTVVHQEVLRGNLTPEQAEQDSRRNVLLQCIGASKTVAPVFIEGKPQAGETYLLCSDGFRRQISADEIVEALHPETLTTEIVMKKKLVTLIEWNKRRRETDNISAVLVKL